MKWSRTEVDDSQNECAYGESAERNRLSPRRDDSLSERRGCERLSARRASWSGDRR
jgi:hypothetical protein